MAHPDLAGMVGLFAYNAPACMEALRSQDKLGKVKISAFDEQIATLDAIAEGTVLGTVIETFQYGYHSVRILNDLHAGDESVLPEGGTLTVVDGGDPGEPRGVPRQAREGHRRRL